MFKQIKELVKFQFDILSLGELFTVNPDREAIWDAYLSGFSDEERQGHNCNCCKSFIRQWGGIVGIVDNRMVSIWDAYMEDVPVEYHQSIKNLREYVHSLPISDIFRNDFPKLGTDFNFASHESGVPVKWTHFYVEAPRKFVVSATSVDTVKATFRDNKSVLKRSLEELTMEATETVLELIAQNSLYKGNEFEPQVKAFWTAQKQYAMVDNKDLFCWEKSLTIPQSVSRIRNTSIGTLLVDLSEGKDLDQAVASYEQKVAPTNYKRPTSAITGRMIEDAQKRIMELGLESALQRRHAVETDISVNDILFIDKSSAATDVFGALKQEVKVNPKSLSKVEEIGISDFITNVLPTSKSLHVMLENRHLNNFVSLIAPVESSVNRLFKWDNNFSWAYTNGVTDSIKERVKAAGGNVEGFLRVSLSWHNFDDLDLHITEPVGQVPIYYGHKRSSYTGGELDVDMNAGRGTTREPVENVIWTQKNKLAPGKYTVQVNNFAKREGAYMGYTVEVEYEGQSYFFESKSSPQNRSTDTICRFEYDTNAGIKFTLGIPTEGNIVSKEKWGVSTNQFIKVKTLCLSPNYWDGQIGNKHFMFMLENCISDEAPRPFFNEFLKEELTKDRKVFEVLGSKIKVEPSTNQLSGVGFSDTQRDHIFVKVEGNFSRVLKVII